jgi:hypothetical protein
VAYDPNVDAKVRKVLYKPSRTKTINDHLASIDLLMNFNPNVKSSALGGDAGSGPNWYVPHTGKLSPLVVEAADRCDKVASLLLEIHDELAHLDIPAADKTNLRTGLAETAQAMKVRAGAWRAPGKVDPKTKADEIASHQRAGARAFQNVILYLHDASRP